MKKMTLWFLCFGFMLFLTACSEDKPTPQERLQTYLDDWQQQDFAAMYQKLSSKSQKNISKEEFINDYKKYYKIFEVHDLSIKAKFKNKEEADNLDEKDNIRLPFHVQMNTMAGPVTFSEKATLKQEKHNEDETNWFVDWETKMIFPQMKNADTKIYSKTIPAKRGAIKDRHGNALVRNGPVISIGIWPGKLQDASKKKLAEKANISIKSIDKKLDASWVQADSFVPITKLPTDDKEQIKQLAQIPGVQKREKTGRIYPLDKAAGALTGYIGGITAEQLEKRKDKGYDKNDSIGKKGLEKIYEDRLRGEDGAEIYTTDKDGNRLATIAKKKPKDGETIQLTIDADLQQTLYEEMKNDDGEIDTGTAAAINPQNGQVLALISTPTFDPNDFILGMSDKKWEGLRSNPEEPLLNRFAERYAPGSAFKPITAAIALKTDAIDPQKKRKISGKTWQPKDNAGWGDYKVRRVHATPEVNLQKAFIYSDNIYFAQTARKIGGDKFLKNGKEFGLGKKLPFPYPIEPAQLTSGNTFDSDVELANSGYGQGKVAISALQFAMAYTPFINEGNLLKPSLELKKAKETANIWQKKAISSDVATTIKKNLRKVVANPNGTGHGADIEGLAIAGKTGTAELKKSKDTKNGRENGWFVGFNSKDPKLLINMMVENVHETEPEGSAYVVPKVADALENSLK